jgi:hypothetical protein
MLWSPVIVMMVWFMTLPGSPQEGLNGTWERDGTADGPSWGIFLRVDGQNVTGLVSRCADGQTRPRDIVDGRLQGKTLTFRCSSADRDRTVTFVGSVAGDSIAFTWQRSVRAGGVDNAAVDRMFGPEAPRQFTVKRTANGALAKAADEVRGSEFAAAVNLSSSDAKAEAVLLLPDRVEKIRAVIIPIDYGMGHAVYDAPEWRQLAEGIGAALVRIRFSSIDSRNRGLATVRWESLSPVLQRLSAESGHPELAAAPLVLWGHSGGGGAASLLSAIHPERVAAFIRYNSGPVGGDLAIISKIPSLIISGGQDATAPPSAAEGLWKRGRAVDAPWTFAVSAEAGHGGDLPRSAKLMTAWTAAVVRHRLPLAGATLREVTPSSGWLGDNRTGAIAPYTSFTGDKTTASWLPDEPTARAWRDLHTAPK